MNGIQRPDAESRTDGWTAERGQSTVIGYILLLGFIITAVGVLLVIGGQAIGDTQQQTEIANAEQSMSQLDAELAKVALMDETDTVTVTTGNSGPGVTTLLEDDEGWVRVEIKKGGTTTVLQNMTMGKIVKDFGDTQVVYQGGGVWKESASGSTMLTPPEFHYEGSTVTFPVISLTGTAGGNTLRAERDSVNDVFPNPAVSRVNPIEEGKVVIWVQSEHYQAWARFFRTRTSGSASTYSSNETVKVELLTPIQRDSVDSALRATSATGVLDMQGTDARVDSYNSSIAPYPSSQTSDGTMASSGDIEIGGNAGVEGNLTSGGEITYHGSASVTGWLKYTAPSSDVPPACCGAAGSTQISGIENVDSLGTWVTARTVEIKGDNDNGEAGVPIDSSDRIDWSGGTATLDSGTYFLEKLEVDSGETLTIDASSGEVRLAVNDTFTMDGGTIDIDGSDRVSVFVRNYETNSYNSHGVNFDKVGIKLLSDSEILVDDDEASRLWFYGNSTMDIVVEGPAVDVTGVFYAPAGLTGTGEFYTRQSDIYGAVLTGEMTIGNKGSVHYDKALQDVRPIPRNAQATYITYMHVTQNVVEVTDD